ncbi:hypothetical protein ACFW04_003921 [Cataglyphis niger]
MMWAPLLLAGFLSGWWGALVLAAAPPAIRDTLGATTSSITETRHYRPPSIADVREITESQLPGDTLRQYTSSDVRPARPRDLDKVPPTEPSPVDQEEKFFSKEIERHFPEDDARHTSRHFSIHGGSSLEMDLGTLVTSNPTQTVDPAKETKVLRAFHPEINESVLTSAPRHSSTQTPFMYAPAMAESTSAESSMERPRIARSVKQRPKNRAKADSPREQRRRCRNKERSCRGQNWCPDVDVGNRAYLAPTVFEGKVRSMSSLRKPGSNYAVTFEVKQVYKSQPGFQPLQKNDSVRLHFRDKSAPGKSTVCNGHETGNKAGKQQQQQQQQRDNPSGVVRANIKRGKVYLVFVNRVGPRNFTILGPPVIRSKKNEQAVQAVVRPDYARLKPNDIGIIEFITHFFRFPRSRSSWQEASRAMIYIENISTEKFDRYSSFSLFF